MKFRVTFSFTILLQHVRSSLLYIHLIKVVNFKYLKEKNAYPI